MSSLLITLFFIILLHLYSDLISFLNCLVLSDTTFMFWHSNFLIPRYLSTIYYMIFGTLHCSLFLFEVEIKFFCDTSNQKYLYVLYHCILLLQNQLQLFTVFLVYSIRKMKSALRHIMNIINENNYTFLLSL